MKRKLDNSDRENKCNTLFPDLENINGTSAADNTFIAPFTEGSGGEYLPRHLSGSNMPYRDDDPAAPMPNRQGRGDVIPQPDGSNIAPNGAVIRNPWSDQPEIRPDHEYTPEKEDLDLLIM